MTTDGGGWTVFQRRSGLGDFHRGWAEYAAGFGSVAGDHRLGNDRLSALTQGGAHELYVELNDFTRMASPSMSGLASATPPRATRCRSVPWSAARSATRSPRTPVAPSPPTIPGAGHDRLLCERHHLGHLARVRSLDGQHPHDAAR
ncbi:MAG: hypothetical protein KIT14_06875 [bacterium]|nr:hypothetical protein [bacterium]